MSLCNRLGANRSITTGYWIATELLAFWQRIPAEQFGFRHPRTWTKAAPEVADRNESVGLMEPLRIRESSRHRTMLTDLAVELTGKSAGFRRSLTEGVLPALADLVRAMNCYYSNLIEGHDTHPVDIERALKNDYSADATRRNLQLEARAHVTVQKWIENGGLKGRGTAVDDIMEIHRRFGELLPEDLLWAEAPKTGKKIRVTPGKLRTHDVKTGRHIPVSPGALLRFLERFEAVHSKLGRTDGILAAATTHHRLPRSWTATVALPGSCLMQCCWRL
ncbi:MAG: hypothetical protein OXC54_12035 [Rhodospirillaceae bacterium]|nr:hypothetical protein [Rhodospirillaceae bacterium]